MRKMLFSVLPFLLFSSVPASASPKPEYMKLKIGDAVEVDGEWDKKAGVFVADDIEKLPDPRRPKLRGAIVKILTPEKSFVLFGVKIKVDDKTEFMDNGGQAVRFENFKAKMRVEVTSRVDEFGNWIARKIETGKLKPSDKIKGTVTRLAFDGTPPDTFEISGLKILVVEGTDLFGPWGTETPALTPGSQQSAAAVSPIMELRLTKTSTRRD
ncbi:MAG: DUF5666 domain-containing protein [candidate division Zixibacteria bacterium]|nr:DUF5666 domain-containing protein [candidate division Zixibacteria bacterium]